MITKIAGYARFSREDKRSGSIQVQKERIVNYAKAMNAQIVAIHVDDGVSGAVPYRERPGLVAAIEQMKSGQADAIVAVALDRYTRDRDDGAAFFKLAAAKHWSVIALDETINLGSAIGRMFLFFRINLAAFERELTGERLTKYLAGRREAGRRFSRFAPWGQKLSEDGETLERDAAESEIVARVLAMHDAGYSSDCIAQELQRPNPRTGKAFSGRTVRRIIDGAKHVHPPTNTPAK